MPSLDQKKITNSYIISQNDDFSFKFDNCELDSIVKAGLSLKKNIIFLKNENAKIELRNEEVMVNNSEFLFIPHRLKKQFTTIDEYLK